MYYEDLLETAVNDETSVEFELRKREAVDAIKRLDKHYEKYSIPFYKTWKDGKYHKRVNIELYGSGSTGNRIRNAVTGVKYNFMVGSSYEDLFFKVTDSTGRSGRRDPLILYYDSPEQYENHQFTNISTEIKQKWHKKFLKAQKELDM